MKEMERFISIRHLGKGGMGEVFLAVDQETNKQVAVKVLRCENYDLPIDAFEHEIECMKLVNHELVPAYIADGTWGGDRAVAMEYVPGTNLAKIMVECHGSEGPIMNPKMAAGLMADVLETLHSIHNLGIVHRDVSPHNIVVGDDGRAHLIDFGVAQSPFRKVPDVPGVLVGKVAYMSPEQASGFAVDGRSDQFSAGVILWEILAGHRLFRAGSDSATWRKVLACDIPPLPLDGILSSALMRMLSANRTERFSSCASAMCAMTMFQDKDEVIGGFRAKAPI